MKEQYIKLLAESYAAKINADGWIDQKIDPTDLQEHFRFVLTELRETMPDLHEQIRHMNKFAQQKIFDEYFNQIHFEEVYGDIDWELTDEQLNELYDELITNNQINLAESGFENFIKNNQKIINGFIDDTRKVGEPNVTKPIQNKLKKQFGATVGSAIGGTIGTIIAAPFKAVWWGLTTIFPTSWVGFGMGAAILAILILGARPISRTAFKVLYVFGAFLQKVEQALSKINPVFRLSYIMIQKNSSECYESCNVDPKDTTYTHYLYNWKSLKDLSSIVMSEEKMDQVKCLRQCYLYSVKESIKLQANVYFNCLKSTGDLSRLPAERDMTMYQRVLKDSKLSDSCEPFRLTLMETFGKFDELLNLIYSTHDVSKKQQHRNDIMEAIYKLQQDNNRGPVNYKPQAPPRDGKFIPRPQDKTFYKKDQHR